MLAEARLVNVLDSRSSLCLRADLHSSGPLYRIALVPWIWLAVAASVPPMSQEGEARLARAMAGAMNEQDGPDYAEAAAKRDALLALA